MTSSYWAANELTAIESTPSGAKLSAPFACPGFTIAAKARPANDALHACFDLPRGPSEMVWA